MSNVSEIVVLVITVYLSVGLVIAIGFVGWGVSRVDPAARNASIAFRILLVPGCVALWPWILCCWKRAFAKEQET